MMFGAFISIDNIIYNSLTYQEKTMKSVAQFDLNDNLVAVFPSITAAENQTKIRRIRECANQKRKTAGGYYWRFYIGE